MIQIFLTLAVDDATDVALQRHQPSEAVAAHVGQQKTFDLVCTDATGGFFLDIVRQIAVPKAEHGVLGELGFVHRHIAAVHDQVMHAVARDPAAFEESRHQKVGIERSQLLGDDVGLHRIVAAQRGIGTAYQNWIEPAALQSRSRGQCLAQVVADLARDRSSPAVRQAAGVGQHEEQRRVIGQRLQQRVDVPTGQQQTTVDRLRTRRVVVEDNDFGVGHRPGSNRRSARATRSSALRPLNSISSPADAVVSPRLPGEQIALAARGCAAAPAPAAHPAPPLTRQQQIAVEQWYRNRRHS